MPSIFPDGFDTDLEIPRVDKNVTEINGDIINSLRDAIFAMQRAMGLNGQGNKPSLVDRINVAIDPNGNITKAALEAVGLVTLPITNKQVGETAGIVESKLKLDHATQVLRNLIESLRVDLNGALQGLSSTTAAFNSHLLGTGNFHDGYQIKVNNPNVPQVGIAGLESVTIGDALNELAQILLTGDENRISHIDVSLVPGIKHRAGNISVDPTEFVSIDRTSTDVQKALNSIDREAGALGTQHVDTFHANGILKFINSGTLYNENQRVLGPQNNASYDEGTSVITIPNVDSFAELGVRPGDLLEIEEQVGIADAGVFQIRALGPLTASQTLGDLPVLDVNQLAIFHVFRESRAENDNIRVNIYKPASVPSEIAPLACSVRHNSTIVDTISILNPDAARVVSVGFNNSIINSDGYELAIRAGIGGGLVRDIIIPYINRERLGTGQAQPVSASSVVERINAYVSDPDLGAHFPISAYRIGNEIAIAHNWAGSEYTLEVVDGYTANFALGLDAYGANVAGYIVTGNEGNLYSVNGTPRSDIAVTFDGYAEITANANTFVLWNNNGQMINPLRYGIKSGSVMHVTGHPTKNYNGSYTLFGANSTTVSTFPAEPIVVSTSPTRFNVKFTDSNVPLSELDDAELNRGVMQVYVTSEGRMQLHERLMYGDNFGSAVEIVDISHNFPVGDIIVSVALDSTDYVFTLIEDSLPGETVTIPSGFEGIFKLYHPNNVDFIVINIIPGTLSSGIEVMRVSGPLVSDETLELCNVHFDGSLTITNLTDTRLFGNLSQNQVRDDFIEIFSQRPVSDLRSNGVARGFDVMDIPFVDEISQMQGLPLRGGVAYVNGVRVTTETQKVIVPSYDEEGVLLTGAHRIIGINEFGTIQSYSDELGEFLSDGYSASVKFGKILPLYRITITEGGIEEIIDLRLFINNLDEKIDIIVDETNNVVGNFRTLEGALLYAENYPGAEKLTVRIMNTVKPARPIVVPRGISLLGNVPYGGEGKHQIIADDEFGSTFITLSGENRLEHLEISSSTALYNNPLLLINGSNVNVEKCLFKYDGSINTNSGDIAITFSANADRDVRIVNNKIDNVFSGITSQYGCEHLFIVDNEITNIKGTGGVSDGINLGSTTWAVDTMVVRGNTIKVPDLASLSDVRGIYVNVGEEIKLLRIDSNYILHDDDTEMSNGIRVENADGTGSIIKQLYLTDNYIKGIKLDDNNVYGMYLNDIGELIVNRNKLENIGTAPKDPDDSGDVDNTNVVGIYVGNTVNLADISNNTLKDCDLTAGIEITNGDRATLSNNNLRGLGAFAWYIVSNSPHSKINDNVLIGPGHQGIRITGTNSLISGNHMSKPNDGSGSTDYAFKSRAIHIQTSNVDVVNNTILGMEYSQLSIGITNVNTSRQYIKITGNTISGNKMAQLIQLYGSGHTVCNNRLFNTNKADSDDSIFIELNSVDNSLISGNSLQGEATRGITNITRTTTTNTTLSNTTIVNNDISATFFTSVYGLAAGPLMLYDVTGSIVTNCLIANNRAPIVTAGTSNNLGLLSPTTSQVNNNVIGINVGASDRISVPLSMGHSAIQEDGYRPSWAISGANDYWRVVNADIINEPRHLYFPIMNIPNGSKLTGIALVGFNSSNLNITVNIYRKSLQSSGLPLELLGTVPTSASSFNPLNVGITSGNYTYPNGVNAEIVNYNESTYFVEIINNDVSVSESAGYNLQIHGLKISFTY